MFNLSHCFCIYLELNSSAFREDLIHWYFLNYNGLNEFYETYSFFTSILSSFSNGAFIATGLWSWSNHSASCETSAKTNKKICSSTKKKTCSS